MLRRFHPSFAFIPLAACLAAGCQFRPNPLFIADGSDMTSTAIGPRDDGDFASPLPADLGAPATPPPPGADLASSPCTRVNEPFTHDPTPAWTIMGDATIDGAGSGLQLTSLGFDVAGCAFYSTPLVADAFDARFKFRVADGSGADGLAFVVAKAPSAGALTPYGNGMINAGYGLGYLGMDGFAVEIDTFMNVGNGDPNGNHVSFVRTADGTHRLNSSPATMLLRSSTPRTAHIRMASGHLTVEIDGATTIDADLPADFAPPSGNVFFGFTGASSALNDRHTVSDLQLTVGPAALCL